MIEEARISFFEIERCGFYPRAEATPAFGGCDEIFRDLKAWVKEKAVRDTSTFVPDEDSSLNPTYCYDIHRSKGTGDFLVTTWNESFSKDGKLPSVLGNQGVGVAGIELSTLPQDAIPGFPSYFWVLPSLNKIACIQFSSSRLNGRKNFDSYIQGYAAKFSKFVVNGSRADGEWGVIGYRDKPGPALHLTANFQTLPIRLKGRRDFIIRNQPNIRKVLRKEFLKRTNAGHFQFLQKLFQFVNADIPRAMAKDLPVKYEFPHTPTEDELDRMVTSWEASHATSWDDIGFEITGDPATYWLSKSRASALTKLEIERDHTGVVVNGSSLLKALIRNRDSLLLTYSDEQ